jgi:predicted LPLAT superfamily acyltransferase
LIINELQKGKGVILTGAHFGNWELAASLLQGRLNAKVNLLMYDAESEAVKTAVSKAVEKRLVNIIYIGNDAADTTVALVNALQRGEIVCLHGDRVFANQRFEEISFLGKKARFPVGPFLLSAAAGSPVIPIFSMKTGLLHYSFSALHPFNLENVSRTERMEKIRSACNNYVCELEKMVRKYPLQWFNFYHFWG